MKKFFVAMLAAFAIIVSCGQSNRAEAYDYYVGNFPDGLEAYVMTETLIFNHWFDVSVKVKRVTRSGQLVNYVEYHILCPRGKHAEYSTSEGERGDITTGLSPSEFLAAKICDFAQDFRKGNIRN